MQDEGPGLEFIGPEDMPRRGTPEQIAAAAAVLEGLKGRGVSAKSYEYKRALMKHVRLLRTTGPPKRRELRARILRAQAAEIRARKALEQFQDVVKEMKAAPLVAELVRIARTNLLPRLADRTDGKPCKACGRKTSDPKAEQQLMDLIKAVYRVEKAREPAPAAKREVSVREWPSEGSKA